MQSLVFQKVQETQQRQDQMAQPATRQYAFDTVIKNTYSATGFKFHDSHKTKDSTFIKSQYSYSHSEVFHLRPHDQEQVQFAQSYVDTKKLAHMHTSERFVLQTESLHICTGNRTTMGHGPHTATMSTI